MKIPPDVQAVHLELIMRDSAYALQVLAKGFRESIGTGAKDMSWPEIFSEENLKNLRNHLEDSRFLLNMSIDGLDHILHHPSLSGPSPNEERKPRSNHLRLVK